METIQEQIMTIRAALWDIFCRNGNTIAWNLSIEMTVKVNTLEVKDVTTTKMIFFIQHNMFMYKVHGDNKVFCF